MKAKTKNKFIDATITLNTLVLFLLAVVGVFSCSVWGYLKANPVAGPDTSVVTYANTITDELGEEHYLMELDYWDNSKGNGIEVAEFSFNAYSGTDCTTVLKKGVQFNNLSNKQGLDSLVDYLSFSHLQETAWNRTYYDKDGGASWQSVDGIKTGVPMYITMDNTNGEPELFEFILNGTFTTYTKQFNFGKSFVNAFRGLAGNVNYSDQNTWYDYLPETHEYTMNDFLETMFTCLTKNNIKYGTNVLSLVDLAKFFEIKKFNTQTEQWDTFTDGHDTQKSYFSVKVNLHEDGLQRASDSVYGMYATQSDFTLIDTDNYYEDYTSVKVTQILGAKDFDYYFSEAYNGYVAIPKVSSLQIIEDDEDVTITVNVNDTFFGSNRNIVGFEFKEEDYLKIKSISVNLNCEEEANFYIIDNLTDEEFNPKRDSISITNSNGTVAALHHIGANYED